MNKMMIYAEILRQLRDIPDEMEAEDESEEMESEESESEEEESEDEAEEETPSVRGSIEKAMKNGK